MGNTINGNGGIKESDRKGSRGLKSRQRSRGSNGNKNEYQKQQRSLYHDRQGGGGGGSGDDDGGRGEGGIDTEGLDPGPPRPLEVHEHNENKSEILEMDLADSPYNLPFPLDRCRSKTSLRQMSSRRFIDDNDRSNQWKIFNALNINDDKMMLDLSAFLARMERGYLARPSIHRKTLDGQELKDDDYDDDEEVPELPPMLHGGTSSEDVFSMDESLLEKDDADWSSYKQHQRSSFSETTLNLQDIEIMQNSVPDLGLLRIGSVDVNLESIDIQNLKDYNLERDTFTVSTVHEVIHLYMNGGQLNIKSVRRILRESYKALKLLPNINVVDMNRDTTVTVVGDLHGQLNDLLHILSCNFPSANNKYIFNGDFVDRGPKGVEILVILYLLINVLPGSVFLNRGNHEDFGLSCVYGFQKECLQKYNHVVFAMFGEMFCHIPICSIIANKIFVVHGGLFHRQGVTLDEIAEVNREKYTIPHNREFCESYLSPGNKSADLMSIMVCALWSDPDLGPSYPAPELNPRGAGILFGPDLMEDFLTLNGLSMVVRSHECVEAGFDLPFEDEMEDTCATVFSASNYGGSTNKGAVIKFSYKEMHNSKPAGGKLYGFSSDSPVIYYRVYDWKSNTSNADVAVVERANKNGLSSLVLRRKRYLMEAFRQLDKNYSGYLSLAKWAMVMENVIGLEINWLSVVDTIVDKSDLQSTDDGPNGSAQSINYASFLSKFHAQYQTKAMNTQSSQLIDAVYSKREMLEGIFLFFDNDRDGFISRNEFNAGCEILNLELSPKDRLTNTDAIWDMMDLTMDGCVCVNEFFEVFRLIDSINMAEE